jgi:hypothetical protein
LALVVLLLLTAGAATADEAGTPEGPLAVSEPVAPAAPGTGSGEVSVSEPVAPLTPPPGIGSPPPREETPGEEPPGEEPPREETPNEEQTGEEGTRTGRKLFIGTNDAAGWGPQPAARIREAHIAWARVDILDSFTPELQAARKAHFEVLGIVGNTPDETPIANQDPQAWAERVVRQLRSSPGVAIAEAGNEVYLKGGRPEPAHYGRMYLAAVNALRAAGIRTPLLFNMRGDYPIPGTESWSRDSAGGGWLRDAVNAVPGLAAAILANGISIHPYGALNENSADTSGVRAAAADEAVARQVLGAVPPFYVTEFGYDLGACGWSAGACSQAEQAAKMKAAYDAFMSDPHIDGIWWYQSHDDSTGRWGFMNHDNSIRPSFNVLAAIAAARGRL